MIESAWTVKCLNQQHTPNIYLEAHCLCNWFIFQNRGFVNILVQWAMTWTDSTESQCQITS
jgi:hypothetical protein